MTTMTLTGISGKSYLFEVHAATGVKWNAAPGLYGFIDPQGVPKYLGETINFASRRPGTTHETWTKAKSYGANLVIAMVLRVGEAARKAAETDLIRAYNPPANVQKRRGATLLTGRRARGFGS